MPVIYHALSDRNVGGAGVFLSELLAVPNAYTGSLVLLPEGSLLFSHLTARGIPCRMLSFGEESSFSLGALLAFWRFFRSAPPALVVSHACLSARVAARLLGVPAVAVRHCDTPVRGARLLYGRVTDATVATSLPAAARLQKAGIHPVLTIENGFTPLSPPTPQARQAARASLSIPKDALAVGLCGRLAPIKGHATAIGALARLGVRGANVLLCFLGTGEEEATLRRLAKEKGVEARVRFLGFRDDPTLFYHAIDAHISCSLGSETSSLALAEGMSAACPTFATDIPGNRARVGMGGRFFPVGDEEALAHLFRRLSDARTRAALSAAAYERARHLPTWERVRRDYATLFRAFCKENDEKGCFFLHSMLQ